MNEQIQLKIDQLKAELEAGQKVMDELETQRSNITYTLLRINGAIQVLEELVRKEESI
ncbi:MAG TPA: hypothetical protein VHP38_10185 [Ruminiclostridium sp.]|nr:hypothetical protein [Ruminiclostridium sp.]